MDEYSKAFAQMRGGIKARKDCKDRIEGMESDARYIKKLEGVLSSFNRTNGQLPHAHYTRWYSNQGGSRKEGQGQECVGGVERVE